MKAKKPLITFKRGVAIVAGAAALIYGGGAIAEAMKPDGIDETRRACIDAAATEGVEVTPRDTDYIDRRVTGEYFGEVKIEGNGNEANVHMNCKVTFNNSDKDEITSVNIMFG